MNDNQAQLGIAALAQREVPSADAKLIAMAILMAASKIEAAISNEGFARQSMAVESAAADLLELMKRLG